MRKNTIVVENKINETFFLIPWKVRYDKYNIAIAKRHVYHNSIPPYTSKKLFHYIPFCMEKNWNKYVIGDSLEILVFTKDSLENEDDLKQLIEKKSYTKKISLSYEQLVNNGCQISIE